MGAEPELAGLRATGCSGGTCGELAAANGILRPGAFPSTAPASYEATPDRRSSWQAAVAVGRSTVHSSRGRRFAAIENEVVFLLCYRRPMIRVF